MSQEALITDIQHFSLHDGPGIRTTVFFKGCPLSCRWCHNPEAISGGRDLLFYSQFCTLCGKCVSACTQGCFSISDEKLSVKRENCTGCGNCIEACTAEALELKGNKVSVEDILSECLIDRNYYKRDGGVTLSGGEPLIKGDFLFGLMHRLKMEKIHIVLDTCGFIPFENLKKSQEWVNLYYFDLKCISREKHIEWAGVDNTIILKNLKKLIESGAETVARIPVIPGFNADMEEMELIVEFLLPYKDDITAHLLPYHNLGSNKYSSLGKPYLMNETKRPAQKEMEGYNQLFINAGINTVLFSN